MRRPLLLLTLLLALLPVAPAGAAGGAHRVIADCSDDGRLEGHYTQAELKQALASIPSDVDEYTDCRSLIEAARGAAGGGGFGGFGGAAGRALTPAEKAAIARAVKEGARPQRVGDGDRAALVRPAAIGRRVAAGTSDVPLPLLLAAILLALAALAASVPAVRQRVLARRAG